MIMSKVYDCFIFFNESRLLELRMEILDPYVDYFVLSESPWTHAGNPKKLYFEENKHLFKKFEHKIIHQVNYENDPNWITWQRDPAQKNALKKMLLNCADDDIIMDSDCDEIPNMELLNLKEKFQQGHTILCYQDLYYYYVNTIAEEGGKRNTWVGTRITNWGNLKNYTMEQFRNDTMQYYKDHGDLVDRVYNCGWHWSYLGGLEAVLTKINQCAHQEFNNDFIKNNVASRFNNLQDPFFRPNYRYIPIPITKETHPAYLVDNQDKYSEFIYK
jgi:beta-1,4-mannosyl-glycoprotein beta-1,4-N-acetylglucosaminyltransferase